ncbi:ATP-binding cassette (ABC) Superfamily [Phytophthora palmivora]|uniref:ATP-binding cassette (ABC) Superfamily n=1 Tax=Phytophthora palmivora TaxID=4796 RepID=A0A2P4XNH9_9STRA|nr:ATP-binding cassette (ABC) Superfamily [Phytophthora palmivora]
MAQGPQALHDHVASRMEKALGTELPQMEVRFQNVSISSDIVVKDKANITTELPTLPNVLKTSLRELQSKKHVVTKQILKNVSGVFKPGTITLILGQPGSGKSSLLKLLSGRFPKNGVAIEGQVTYNGISSSDLHKNLPQLVSYVAQRDKHHPILTVKETLGGIEDEVGIDVAVAA